MKKIIGIIVFSVLGTVVFANETWHSFGLGFRNNYDRILRLDFSTYKYFNDVGMIFFNCDFTKPINVDNTDYYFQFSTIVGPGVKFNLNEITKLNIGIGFSYQFIFGEYKDNLSMHFNLGYGGDINLAFIISESIYLHFGTTVNQYFVNFRITKIGNHYQSDEDIKIEWTENYSMFDIRPYIGVGFIIKK